MYLFCLTLCALKKDSIYYVTHTNEKVSVVEGDNILIVCRTLRLCLFKIKLRTVDQLYSKCRIDKVCNF